MRESIKMIKSGLLRAALLIAALGLAACGGGGGGGGGDSSSSSSTTPVAGTPRLALVFSQGGAQKAYTLEAGVPTVTLHNTPFQILIPNTAFTNVYLRVTNDNSGGVDPAGNGMARALDENSAGWYLAQVPYNDTSINSFSYADTLASGGKRVLNIKEIRDRFQSTKTAYSVLYLQFYIPTSPTSAIETETVKVRLN